MKPEETVQILKLMQERVEWDYPMDYAAAIDRAIEALEKEIPKPVRMHPDKIGRFICPKCNKHFEFAFGKHRCEYCGQKIKFPDSVFDGIELASNDSRILGWEGDDE